MIRKFKLHKIAGPSGTFAGYILLIFGAITSIFVITGLPVLILGLYLAFGYFSSTIDADNRRVRSGIMLFGWSLSGKWIEIDDTYLPKIRQVKTRHTVHSAGNRTLDLNQIVYKIVLISSVHSREFSLAVFQDEQEAQDQSLIIQDLLQLKKPEI